MVFEHRTSHTSLALVGIGEYLVGIPLAYVVQAITKPDVEVPPPRRNGAMSMVVNYMDRSIPVVDISKWVPMGTPSLSDSARILILQYDNYVLGIHVDSVFGVKNVLADEVQRLSHGQDSEEIFNSVITSESGNIQILDVHNLRNLVAVWNEVNSNGPVDNEQSKSQVTKVASEHISCAIFTVDSQYLAVPSEYVSEVIPRPEMSGFFGTTFDKMCDWRGRKLPVTSANKLFEVAGNTNITRYLLAVICVNDLAFGIEVDQVHSIEQYPADDLCNDSNGPIQVKFFINNVPTYILNPQKMVETFSEISISTLSVAVDKLEQSRTPMLGSISEHGYIVFDGDGPAAICIDVVEEVLPTPAIRRADQFGEQRVISWRTNTVELIDMRGATQNTSQVDTSTTLIIRSGKGLRALQVNAVTAYIQPGNGWIHALRLGAPKLASFISTLDGNNKASYRLIDY